ncbi:NADH dehydrogenase (ubiquinone) 1 alpha subcomplex subunit 5, partial [Tremellales sp. Uapishka_1]
MLRATKTLFSALKPIKISTGITGLAVHPEPLPALKSTYTSTISILATLPSTSVYRQATETLTEHRLSVVESAGGDIEKVEQELGNIVEVLLEEGKAEALLAGKMGEWKSYEGLEQTPPRGQWQYFDPGE